MSYPDTRHPRLSLSRRFQSATSLVFVFFALLFVPSLLAQEGGTGRISGVVTSKGSGNALQGAVVLIPSLNRSALTDSTGSFSLRDLPSGALEVVVSYSGFTESSQRVVAESGKTVDLSIQLASAEVVQLEAFTVESVKEGQALAITEQRNAVNIKNVTALDEWGVLPTQNVGELAMRLPGITFTTDEDNLVNNISIRGQPSSYTRLNIDGMSSTGVGGDGRSATLHSFSGSMYEQIEVILGQTPDKRADSLGGQVNLKTKSPLAMRERRRFNYQASARYIPSFADRNVPLADHPLHPDLSFGYTEVFDILGKNRNLGVSINLSYQEVVNPHDWDFLQYQNTTDPVAFVRDYDKRSGLNHRFIEAFSARADYRVSDSTTVSLRFLYNAGDEPFFHYTFVNPFLSNNLTVYNATTNPNGGIMPGYTVNRAEIRPVGNAQMLLTPRKFSFTSKNPTGTLAVEHDWGRWKVDHAYRWSHTHWDSNAGRDKEGGQLTLRTRDPIGFILDTSDLNGRVFTQTAGPSVYDVNSYAAFQTAAANTTTIPVPQTSLRFDKRSTITDTNEVSATVNAQYTFATTFPLTVKFGLDTVNRRVNNWQEDPLRWYGVVGTVPIGGLMPLTEFERQHGGQRLPVFDPASVSTSLTDVSRWYRDVNFTATSRYTNRRIMEEGVDAGYFRFDTKVKRLSIAGGVRFETVSTDTFTYFRARTTPIAVEPDHFKRAALDYNRQSTEGKYDKAFPSIHFVYDITTNLKARASWSTSYGRPLLANLVPAVSFNDTTQTVTVGNPALLPQEAENIDLKLEYYFKNNGVFSASVYRKDIKDYISGSVNSGETVPNTPDNGYEGLYGGYTIFRPRNIGGAKVDGYELSYNQRLTFLPGVLRGVSVRANYTRLKTEGEFAGTSVLTGSAIANFIPKAYNLALLYSYKNFGASFDVNHTGSYPVTNASTASPGLNAWAKSLTTMNAGVTYRVRPQSTVFLTVTNLTEDGREHYTYIPQRPRQLLIAPTAIKLGVSGQF
jgi:iron complex outermembrane receptor protein